MVKQVEFFMDENDHSTTITWYKNYNKRGWAVTVRRHEESDWTFNSIAHLPTIPNANHFYNLYLKRNKNGI